jgi:hypothetical protein
MDACTTCGSCTFAEIPPVPAPNLLRSNDVPSPAEALSIQATLSVVNQDLLRLTNEITRAQRNLHNLMRNHTTLRAFYDRQAALLSPTRCLPPEMLSEIFLEYLISCQEGDTFPTRKCVLLTTQICRYWREVAISTPRLWSALCFDLRAKNMNRELEMAPVWLARSRGVALTLGLHSHHEVSQSHPVTDMILPHAPRWVTLILNTTPSIVHSLCSAKGNLLRLRRLVIDCLQPNLLQSLDTFKVAPQLCSLTLMRKVSVLKPEFAWAQLHELYLPWGHYSVNDCLEILHSSPNLVLCTMTLCESEDYLPRSVVKNHNLRELEVSDCDDLAPLFECLALPGLLTLSCHLFELWPRDEFLSFMHRSSCTLQKLVLAGYHGVISGIADCLRHTPHLLELELLYGSGEAMDTELLRDMIHHTSSPCLLPKLQQLKVSRKYSFDYDAFAAMVESRWRVNPSRGASSVSVERMQRVEICLIDDYEVNEGYVLDDEDEYSESFALLRQLRAEGLDVISPDIEP